MHQPKNLQNVYVMKYNEFLDSIFNSQCETWPCLIEHNLDV